MESLIIGIAIGLYVVWVIRRKIKDIKKGKYCSCGCQDCEQSCQSKK